MEFAKDEVLEVKYDKKGYEKEHKVLKYISKHKFILTLLILGLAVCSIDCILIYNFINVLTNM